MKYGGTIVGTGLLAGCVGIDEGETGTDDDDSPTESETTDETGYSVSMEPVGTLEFDEPPETWLAYTGDYADMGVALGQADGLSAIGVRERFGTHHYEELPGVSVSSADLTELWNEGTGKEVFYELDVDLHVVDPNFMEHRLGWSEDDVGEIADNVAPFFGNTGFTRVYDWHDYRYYSMYEAFEKLANVFRERERYEAFSAYHDEILAEVEGRLPSSSPELAVLYPDGIPPEGFYPYLIGEGTQSKHWRDLNVDDALAAAGIKDTQTDGGTIDYETLLEIDPDAIAIRIQGEITEEYFEREIRSHLRDHAVAGDLRAVRNDRVFYGGLTYQGPIIHLFQLERAARGLYPEEFGGERLFDRERVADIVTGDS
ncbi:ABC transporter substrate-binding protein [Natrarchaeobius sp. A-rgal3]|uniref:ABC transporter substrate-binding protein n=1 Tax=Natrarchaeobius versutus TaxID=1679078 RepID=UPI0035107A19